MKRELNLEIIFDGRSFQNSPAERVLVVEQILQRVDGIVVARESQKGDQIARISRQDDDNEEPKDADHHSTAQSSGHFSLSCVPPSEWIGRNDINIHVLQMDAASTDADFDQWSVP